MQHPTRYSVGELVRHVHWTCLASFLFSFGASHTLAADTTNSPLLTVDRIFDSDDFNEGSVETTVWKKRGPGYFTFEKSQAGGEEKEFVWRDPASDQKEIVMPAHAFIPPGESNPLAIEGLEFSEDESKLLIYTNSKRVWRQKTRGDYWVLDVTSRELRKLGGDAPSSTLMFAKFSPDGTRVAYVRGNNLYVQNLRDLRITPLTTNGSATLINGTSDWVYEEELDLRDGFFWSPDSK